MKISQEAAGINGTIIQVVHLQPQVMAVAQDLLPRTKNLKVQRPLGLRSLTLSPKSRTSEVGAVVLGLAEVATGRHRPAHPTALVPVIQTRLKVAVRLHHQFQCLPSRRAGEGVVI
jgi:hypothetical protein